MSFPIKTVQNFPKEGVNFYDMCEYYSNPDNLSVELDFMSTLPKYNLLFGVESRGFFMTSLHSISSRTKAIYIRKRGKVPGDKVIIETKNEYATEVLEMPKVDVKDKKCLIIDDVIATGGTALAVSNKLLELGASQVDVYCTVLISHLNKYEGRVFSMFTT
jgi:adenine phosphoribosyltransferase